jgi:hypothetical protein
MLKRLSLASAVAAVLALVTVDAFAFPMSPVDIAQPTDQLIQVRQGCGLGRHRGGWGCWNGNLVGAAAGGVPPRGVRAAFAPDRNALEHSRISRLGSFGCRGVFNHVATTL